MEFNCYSGGKSERRKVSSEVGKCWTGSNALGPPINVTPVCLPARANVKLGNDFQQLRGWLEKWFAHISSSKVRQVAHVGTNVLSPIRKILCGIVARYPSQLSDVARNTEFTLSSKTFEIS